MMWVAVVAGLALLAPVGLHAFGEWSRAGETEAAVAGHLERARGAIGAGEFDQAAVAIEAAHVLAPASAAVQRGAMVLAVTQAARRSSPLDDAAAAGLGYALTVLADGDSAGLGESTRLIARGRLAARRGDEEPAQALYEQAVAADGEDVFAHLALARLHRRLGRRVEALAALEAAVAVAPANVAAQNDLGVLLVELDRVEEATRAFAKAIEAEDNVASRMNLATALADAKRVPEAIEHLRRAVQLSPTSAPAHRQLGQLLGGAGQHAEAEAMLLKSLELANDVPAGLSLGRLYQVQERHERAAEVFNAILADRGDTFEAAYLLGASLRALGRDADAVGAYRHYLRVAERIPGEAGRVAEVKKLLSAGQAPAPVPAPEGAP